jgi:hypothetical protein
MQTLLKVGELEMDLISRMSAARRRKSICNRASFSCWNI